MTDKPVPTRGINVKVAMKWLLDTLLLGNIRPVPFAYNSDPNHFGGGSENMKLLYCICGFRGNAPMGQERLINWYKNENGHGGGEPLTVSHGQLHLGGHCAAALCADLINQNVILDYALNWLQIEYNLYSLCEVNGEPWTPGARGVMDGKVVGENPTRGLFLRAVEGRDLIKEVKGRMKVVQVNQYDLGAFCITRLPEQLRRRISAPIKDWSEISIQGDLIITRCKDTTFYAVFQSLPIGGGGVQAAGYDGVDKWIYRDGKDIQVGLDRYAGRPILKQIQLSKPLTNRKVKKVTSAVAKIPQTKAELNEVANLAFNVANGLIAQADKSLVKSWGEELYSNFGKGYLHSSDHYAALTILLEREPTFKEVYDSYHISGSKNIDLARNKVGGGARPTEWDSWTDSQKMQAVLTQLYGIKNGARILDGKMKDPDPEKTQALMKLWGLNEPKEPELPKEPDKPTPEPPTPVIGEEVGIEITIMIEGKKRIYKGTMKEIK